MGTGGHLGGNGGGRKKTFVVNLRTGASCVHWGGITRGFPGSKAKNERSKEKRKFTLLRTRPLGKATQSRIRGIQ